MDQTDSSSFKQRLFIPFHLVDAAGVVFYGHLFTLAHQVFEAFVVEGLGLSWDSWFHHPHWVVPIKHAEATYHAPLRAGQWCQASLSVSEIRRSAFCVDCALTQQEIPCCSVKTVHVFCNRTTQHKQTAPPELISSLEKYRVSG